MQSKLAHLTDLPLPFELDLQLVIEGVSKASQAILSIYDQPAADWYVEEKSDDSPVTEADKLSDSLLRDAWKKASLWPDDAIISEENLSNRERGLQKMMQGDACVFIDPLDGTREFIRKSGQFVINIGVVMNHEPVFGLVHVPISGETVIGWKGVKTRQGVVIQWDPAKQAFRTQARVTLPHPEKWLLRAAHDVSQSRIKVLLSGTAPSSGRLESLSDALLEQGIKSRFVKMGSALKFLRIADSVGDVYLRRAPTAVWDTAAGQAIVESAGGGMISLDERGPRPFRYDADSFVNPSFLCFRPEFSPSMIGRILQSIESLQTTTP